MQRLVFTCLLFVVFLFVPVFGQNKSKAIRSYQNDATITPTFKGGEDSLIAFLANNIQKPKCEQSPEIDSASDVSINVYFVVDVVGTIGAIQTDSKAPQCFIDEAIRVVKLTSGKWWPGTVESQPTNMRCMIPISFTRQ